MLRAGGFFKFTKVPVCHSCPERAGHIVGAYKQETYDHGSLISHLGAPATLTMAVTRPPLQNQKKAPGPESKLCRSEPNGLWPHSNPHGKGKRRQQEQMKQVSAPPAQAGGLTGS